MENVEFLSRKLLEASNELENLSLDLVDIEREIDQNGLSEDLIKSIIDAEIGYKKIHRELYNLDVDLTNNEFFSRELTRLIQKIKGDVSEDISYLLYELFIEEDYSFDFKVTIDDELYQSKNISEFVEYLNFKGNQKWS